MARRRFRYNPGPVGVLEDRVVLTGPGVKGVTSVVVSGLRPGQQVLSSKQQTVSAELNQAFDQFTSDYDQARAVYLSTISGGNASGASTTAFKQYTKQRVSLLAQQIISSFLQSPKGTAHAAKQPPVLKGLIAKKIVDTTSKNDVQGSLANSLVVNIPPAGTPAATASIYALSQDTALQAARAEVLNGLGIVNGGAFGVQAPKH